MKINNQDSTGTSEHIKESALEAGQLLLNSIKEDPDREGLRKTPERFSKAFKELCSGYELTPKEVVGEGIFEAEGSGLVSVKDVEFYSLCEHHLLPFWGSASVAYYPKNKIIGLSKIPRLIDVFSRRLQVQERLTKEVATSLMELVDARAVFVRVTGCHMCMMMRGVKKHASETVTEFSLCSDNVSEIEINRAWRSLE